VSVFDSNYAQGYDALYREKDYGAECDLIERALSLFGPSGAVRVLDVGCGTGGHAIELARRGHRVAGVDLSPHMIELARAKAQDALPVDRRPTFTQGDAREFRVDAPPFDAVVMMFAVLGYLTRNEDIVRALSNIRAHLRPGGLFVCDFWWGPAVLTQRPGERVRIVPTSDGKLLRATRTTLETLSNVAEVHFDLFRFGDSTPATMSAETHLMRYFFGPELDLLCRAAGLQVERLGQFPDLDKAPTDSHWNSTLVARAI
jgi:SAM-dependent methyltransferase